MVMLTPLKMLDLEDGVVDASSTPYSVAATIGCVLIDVTLSVMTVNLPALSSVKNGKTITFRIVAGVNLVTLDGNASELINGATTLVFSGVGGSRTLVARTSGGNAGWWTTSVI